MTTKFEHFDLIDGGYEVDSDQLIHIENKVLADMKENRESIITFSEIIEEKIEEFVETNFDLEGSVRKNTEEEIEDFRNGSWVVLLSVEDDSRIIGLSAGRTTQEIANQPDWEKIEVIDGAGAELINEAEKKFYEKVIKSIK